MKTLMDKEGFFNAYATGMIHAGLAVTAALAASMLAVRFVF